MKNEQSMYKRCVLIGNQGAGKTRLFNIICSQDEQSNESMESNTKIIAQSQSVSGYGFHIQDTPGFGSYDDEVLTHSIGILAALTDGPIHRIIIVVEYQQRMDILKLKIQDTINIVQEYNEIITIIITYKDQCKISVDEYYNKAQEMIRKSFEVESVYFSGSDTQCEELCSFIDNALLENGQIIQISDSKFDKMMQGYIDNVLKQAKEEFYNKFQEFYLAAKMFLENFNSEIEDSQQILHYFISYARKKSASIQNDFEIKYWPFMEELNQKENDPVKAYYYHSVLKHSIAEQVQELIKIANQKMKYPEDHPFRQLRRCLRCGTIWLKVTGCDGITQCGNRTNKYQDDIILINQLVNNYQFEISDNKIKYSQVIQDSPQYTKQQVQFIEIIIQDLMLQYANLDVLIQKYDFNKYEDISQFIQTVVQFLITPEQQQDTKKLDKQQNFLRQANEELKKKFVEQNHRIQIKNGGQIGCGFDIDWQNAPLVDINEIDTEQVQVLNSLQQSDLIYQEQFHIHKQKLIKKAQQEKKVLTQT